MIWFLLIAGALYAAGAAFGAPKSQRWVMIGIVYLAILVATLVLPAGNGLRASLGGSFGEWALLGGFAAIVIAYRTVLRRIRTKANPIEPEPVFDPGEAELTRNMRHILLREIGGPGQKRIKQAKVLVIGAGGLGSPVLQYLGAAGVGTLGVIDDDVVDATNLHRQVIHTDGRIGMPKVFSAKEALAEQNPFIEVRPYNRRFDETCAPLVEEYDLMIDGSDNFDTRYLVNRLCAEAGTPLIAAAITQWEGQISTYKPSEGGPCYQCVFPQRPADGMVPTCAEAGVVGPLPGVFGTMLAMEAIKEITGAGEGLMGRLMIYDALYADVRTIRVKKRDNCPICG